MEETTFQFSEPTVVIALVVVMFVLVLRVMTLGESGGPALEKPGRAKLRNVSGGLLGEAPDDIDVDDEEVLELGDDDNNIIYSTKVSTPLLSRLINHEVIARVAYETPGENIETVYWRFDDSVVGGWRWRRESRVVSCYLKFF